VHDPTLARGALAVAIALALSLVPSATLAQSPGARTLRTADGLGLSLRENGEVAAVALGTASVPSLPGGGGFGIRAVGGQPNVLTNGGFEADADRDSVPDGWSFAGGTRRPRVVTDIHRGGARAVRLYAPDRSGAGMLARAVRVRPGTNYTLSAWLQSREVLPQVTTAHDSAFRIRVSQLSATRTVLDTTDGSAYSGSAGWHRRFVGFATHPSASWVQLTVLFVGGTGTGWIDDLTLRPLFADSWTPVRGFVAEKDGQGVIRHEAAVPGQPLRFQATYREAANHIAVRGSVDRTEPGSSAFQVALTLPVDARGWRWGDNARRDRSIIQGRYVLESARGLQSTSRYPFGTVGRPGGRSISLGMDLADPRVARIDYDSRSGLRITFDLGVSTAATHLGPRASFTILIFTGDGTWGFRSATQKYARILPDAFLRRSDPDREGGWFFRTRPDDIGDRARAYGLGWNVLALGKGPSQNFDTWGRDQLAWANENGLYAAAYTHQWAYYGRRPVGPSLPSYQTAIARLRAEAALTGDDATTERRREEARAAIRSTARDINGRLLYETYSDFLAFYQNGEDLPNGYDWPAAATEHQVERAFDEAADLGGTLDVIHIDSTSGMKRWGAADDYSRGHWAAATLPLTFSYQSGLVVQRGILWMVPRIARLAGLTHARGLLLSANFNAGEGAVASYFGAATIDIFGIERGLPERAMSTEGTTADDFALLKRTIAYQRPLSTFDYELGRQTTTLSETRRRLEQNLFYGIYAGGPVNDFWLRSDRERTFQRYARLIREVSAAGWEPVTYARTNDAKVWVERFGGAKDNDLAFTVRNETATARQLTLTILLGAMTSDPPTSASARERVTGEALALTLMEGGRIARVPLTVPAGATRMVSVDLATSR
jgi:hypothetical protein